jgi:DNA-binding NarL/FixJ family response regulator
MFRLGLRRALERAPDLEIIWEMGTIANLDSVMSKSPVDVVLMDAYLGRGEDGIAATRHVIERWPGTRVVVISASLDSRIGSESIRAGASAFLPKGATVAEMVSSIRELAVASSAGSRSSARPAGRAKAISGRIGGLSPRQRQVLDFLRLGRTNREIAALLGVSTATVNKHVHVVLTVLKVRNRTQAAAVARDVSVSG